MQRNVLIVGGGLAGLCMGVQLYRRNIPFKIWCSEEIPCSSEKAAGLMNPVVVKRLLKTWMADVVLPYNRIFYPEIEKLTGTSFYSQLPVYRMLNNALVQGEWEARIKDGTMNGLMSPGIYAYAPHAINDTGFGGADIFGASMVDCSLFIGSLRALFEKEGTLRKMALDYTAIHPIAEGFEICGESFSQIVFCEGMHVVNNPWFGKLPMVPTKGELLYLDIPHFPTEKEVMKGVFLAPLKQGGFVCGSTYEWQFDNAGATDKGRSNILGELEQITSLSYTVHNHTAGIRPASRDRRPFLGEHPTTKNMFVLNGLGTKGYMLAPYMSECLVNNMLDGTPIPAEMNITRIKVRL